jgi:hypothetical protein
VDVGISDVWEVLLGYRKGYVREHYERLDRVLSQQHESGETLTEAKYHQWIGVLDQLRDFERALAMCDELDATFPPSSLGDELRALVLLDRAMLNVAVARDNGQQAMNSLRSQINADLTAAKALLAKRQIDPDTRGQMQVKLLEYTLARLSLPQGEYLDTYAVTWLGLKFDAVGATTRSAPARGHTGFMRETNPGVWEVRPGVYLALVDMLEYAPSDDWSDIWVALGDLLYMSFDNGLAWLAWQRGIDGGFWDRNRLLKSQGTVERYLEVASGDRTQSFHERVITHIANDLKAAGDWRSGWEKAQRDAVAKNASAADDAVRAGYVKTAGEPARHPKWLEKREEIVPATTDGDDALALWIAIGAILAIAGAAIVMRVVRGRGPATSAP